MKKMAEVCINPLRIAFDHWGMRDVYEDAVRCAVRNGIKDLSNYMLYNFNDRPEELYYRMKLNAELCEELDASIYSFPMKYHPIFDEDYFMNRDFIGENWNKKFVRAVQAVLNSTKAEEVWNFFMKHLAQMKTVFGQSCGCQRPLSSIV